MSKKKHEPLSFDRFMELLKANMGVAENCEDAIRATVAKHDFIGSVSGELLNFFEEFNEEDGQKMALTVIFLLGLQLGRALDSAKEEKPEVKKPRKKKGGNGQPKN